METKLKPFDLEAAKAGAKVITRDGRPVRIICFDRDDNQCPIVGLIQGEYGERVVTFTNRGGYYVDAEHRNDLFMAPEKHEGWVVVLDGDEDRRILDDEIYRTWVEAEESCKEYAGIAVAKVEWEE